MRYADERCNCIVDGDDMLVTVFSTDTCPMYGRCFRLRECLRERSAVNGYMRPRVRLGWLRMRRAALSARQP